MTPKLIAAVLCLLVALPAGSALGQGAGEPLAPETAAQQALDALKENRFDDYTAMMHPEALEKFRGMMVPILEAAAAEGEEEQLLELFEGTRTVDDLKAMDAADFFETFFRGFFSEMPEMRQLMAGSEIKTFGHVLEDQDTAHVVYRLTVSLQGVQINKMSVLSLRRDDSGWKLMLSGDIEGLAKILGQRFEGDD